MLAHKFQRLIPLLLPLAIFWLTGVAGLDYGYHWDEPKLLESVRTSVYEGTYLPTFYNYPSVSHNIAVFTALPEILANIDRNHLNELVFHGHIAAFQLDNHSLTLRTRLVFLTISSLSIVWIYLLMLIWHKSVWLALASSRVLAFSWEVAYHARWIAPDAILMQFGALFLLCLVQAYRYPDKHSWLWASAIVAGLATGTKYPAGLLLFPVLCLATWQKQSRFKAILIFGISYLLTTPGTLLQPFKFWHQVEFEMWHYSVGHSKHTMSAGLEHLLKNFEYLASVQLSHTPIIAVILFGFAVTGIIALWQEEKRLTFLISVFPVVYILYMSMQRAMLIRNLLILVPFIAVWAGLGIEWLWRLSKQSAFRIVWIGLLVLMLSINAVWLVYTAQTIAYRYTDSYLVDLRFQVGQHPDIVYWASSQVIDDIKPDVPANITTDLTEADEILVYLSEIQELDPMPANIPRLFTWQFGSWETNIEYYTWHGDDKIVLMPNSTLQSIGLEPYLE